MKFLKKIFDHEYKELQRFQSIADEIDALEEEMSNLTDKELKHKTEEFKERIKMVTGKIIQNQLNQK